MFRRLIPAAAVFMAAAFLTAPAPASDAGGDTSMPPFPALSGPVVDGANLLPADVTQSLTQQLQAYSDSTGNQLVVVTVPTLNGYPIEYWGYQIGRHWGIGQKDTNTGVLLIVDRDERQVRIEVGYGLEGTLTDAVTSGIIRDVIVPHFKDGDYPGGVTAGVNAILQVLGGQVEEVQKQKRRDYSSTLFLMLFLAFILIRVLTAGFFPRRRGWGWWGGFGVGGFGGGFGGGGFGGGGFSGGGGSFGGGGASGRW